MQAFSALSLARRNPSRSFRQSFRPSIRSTIHCSTLPAFSTCARHHEYKPPSEYYVESNRSRGDVRFSIAPSPADLGDPVAWTKILEDLRIQSSDESSRDTVPNPKHLSLPPDSIVRNVSQFLAEAQHKGRVDLLSYLGVQKGRWRDVSWIVRVVSEQDLRTHARQLDNTVMGGLLPLPKSNHIPLDEISRRPIVLDIPKPDADAELEAIEKVPNATDSLDRMLSSFGDPRDHGRRLQQGALGQVWRSLGNMVLTASTSSEEKSRDIMDHVLDTLAILHHNGVVPDNGYAFSSMPDPSSLSLSPVLHDLSQHILFAILDAEWNMFQKDTPEAPPYVSAAQNKIDGYEFPATRNPKQILPYSHEVWLELILWMCLQGGWVTDGMAVLTKAIDVPGSEQWFALSWNDMMTADQQTRQIPERTVSSELVAAYVDGLLNRIKIGVGERGESERMVVRHLSNIKRFLARSNVNLPFFTWDGVVARAVETGRFEMENDPILVARLLELAISDEIHKDPANPLLSKDRSSPSRSIKEHSAALLGLHHRVLEFQVDAGRILSVIHVLKAINRHLSSNMPLLESHKSDCAEAEAEEEVKPEISSACTENETSTQLPSRFNLSQIPERTLSKLLEIFTGHKKFELAWTKLWTDSEVMSPLFPSHLYTDSHMGPALIRYAVATSDKHLLQGLLEANALKGPGLHLPLPILVALLQSQIEYRKWPAVDHSLNTLGRSHSTLHWHPLIIATLTREILRMQNPRTLDDGETSQGGLAQALEIFKRLLRGGYGHSLSYSHAWKGIHSILGVISSINPLWASFCQKLFRHTGSHSLDLSRRTFGIVLQGVMETLGLREARKLWKMWCHDAREPWSSEYGSSTVKSTIPNRFLSRADGYFDGNRRVEVVCPNGDVLVYRGRITPTIHLFRDVLRGMAKTGVIGPGEMEWAVQQLKSLGLSDTEALDEIEQIKVSQVQKSKDQKLSRRRLSEARAHVETELEEDQSPKALRSELVS